MELQLHTLDNGIRFIKLIGKLDKKGTGEIENKFIDSCAGDKVRVVVDLSEVQFLVSAGIRLLKQTAKSLAKRSGKMALINPIPEVLHVLEVTGTPAIIPIYSHIESAETVLLAN